MSDFHKQRLNVSATACCKEWQLPQVVSLDQNGADPLALPGSRGEMVLYQPSGHGREPEGAVIHCTVDHP